MIFHALTDRTNSAGSRQLHQKGNCFIKPMQLRNVVLTHDSCKRAVLPQSMIQPALPVDIVLIVF